jgi:hypothetical protein
VSPTTLSASALLSVATLICTSGALGQPMDAAAGTSAASATPAVVTPAVAEPSVPVQQVEPAASPTTPAAPTASPAVPGESAAAAPEPSPYDSGEPGSSNSTPKPAKTRDVPATLLDMSADYDIGGMGGVGVMYTRFARTDAVQVCGEGAVIIDHAFTLGGGGCGIVTRIKGEKYGPEQHDPDDRVQFGYGGAIARYHFFSRRVVNLSVGTLIGAGAIAIGTWHGSSDDTDNFDSRTHEAVFVLEPQVGCHANVTRWLRVGVHAGYRLVSGVDTERLSWKSTSSPTLGGTIQVGWF